VNEIIKEHALMLKEATGFRVLIPDLYKGKLGVDKEEAHHVSTSSGGSSCGGSDGSRSSSSSNSDGGSGVGCHAHRFPCTAAEGIRQTTQDLALAPNSCSRLATFELDGVLPACPVATACCCCYCTNTCS
jgi:hypothetical protein